MDNAALTTETATHAFEAAGLGRAPFRFIGSYVSKFQAAPGEPTKPGSSCDYCGQGIANVCRIRDADGCEFKVGCECVRKTGDAGLRRQVDRAIRMAKKAQRDRRAAQRIEAARARLPEVADALRAQPHPKAYRAEKGATLLDWAEWMLENAGTAGRVKVARVVEAAS